MGCRSAVVGKREKYSRKYAFSGMIECGFCGSSYTRGNWHSNTKYAKIVWYCIKGYKKGKKYCPHSKMVSEAMIEEAFVESYKLLCGDNREVLEEFIERVEKTLSESSIEKKILEIDRELTNIESKKKKLLDMRLDDKLEMDAYVSKMEEFQERSEKLLAERDVFEKQFGSENTLKKRVKDFKSLLEKNQVLEEFDRTIFESIVEKIIVGGADDNGEMNPYKITFVYKTGITCETDAKSPYKPRIGKDVAKDVNPVSYKMIDGTSGRTHYGFIAQDIEELMNTLNMDSSDFAGFIKSPKRTIKYEDENGNKLKKPIEEVIENEYDYSLRYDEFIAPLIKVVQEQQKTIEQQQKIIEQQQIAIKNQQKEIEQIKKELSKMDSSM